MKTRAIFAVAVAVMAALTSAAAASAASTGTTPVGSTITATAWERGGLDDFSYAYSGGDVQPLDGFEEYVYRLHSSGANVDVQDTAGYIGLTEAEQNKWYVDAGWDPYEFRWMAFMCLREFAIDSDAPLVNEGINLTEMHYTAADVMFPSADRDYWNDYVPNLSVRIFGGTLFGLDDFDLTKASVTGYDSTAGRLAFSVSYPEFACPAGTNLEMFRIMDSADPDNYATSRELTIPETLVVDAYDNNREIPSDGVFIGVTGFATFSEFNAALWGMTQVDGKLAATGAEVDGLGMLGVGLAVVGLAAFVLRRARQRSV